MDFKTSVMTVLGKYADFSGRASRSEFWYWCLAQVMLYLVLLVVFGSFQPLQTLVSLALLLPSLAVSVRRLHDIDRSGWWWLVAFIPLIGFFILIWWYVQPSTLGANRYS